MAKRRTKAEVEQDRAKRAREKQLTDWLYKVYDVNYLPSYIFVNLQKVYQGTYKNLKVPIPVEDLSEMWEQKINKFKQQAKYQESMGKTMPVVNRISYDLAILISKYDDYCAYKKRKAEMKSELEQTQANRETQVQYDNFAGTQTLEQKKEIQETNENLDIEKLLDEI